MGSGVLKVDSGSLPFPSSMGSHGRPRPVWHHPRSGTRRTKAVHSEGSTFPLHVKTCLIKFNVLVIPVK